MSGLPGVSGRSAFRAPWSRAILVSGALAILVALPAEPQEPTRRLLPDGVELWERPAAGKPWFFRKMESLMRLALPSRDRLPFDRSVAFLVGVSRYRHLNALPHVTNDLEDMRQYLIGSGGFDAVYVAAEGVASPALVEEYMVNRFLRELTPRDRLLFYYAGHADDLDGTTGYLQFATVDPGNFAHDVLPIQRTEEWSRVIKARHILFIYDACSSGLAFSPQARGKTDEATVAALAALSGSGSRVVVTAGTADERTYEVVEGGRGNGVFTRALLDALQVGVRAPLVTITEAFADAERRVRVFADRYGKPLTPRMWVLDDRTYRGTFVFVNPSAGGMELPAAFAEALLGSARGQPDDATPAPPRAEVSRLFGHEVRLVYRRGSDPERLGRVVRRLRDAGAFVMEEEAYEIPAELAGTVVYQPASEREAAIVREVLFGIVSIETRLAQDASTRLLVLYVP